jgi:hypothetical protein
VGRAASLRIRLSDSKSECRSSWIQKEVSRILGKCWIICGISWGRGAERLNLPAGTSMFTPVISDSQLASALVPANPRRTIAAAPKSDVRFISIPPKPARSSDVLRVFSIFYSVGSRKPISSLRPYLL